jgi:hypothetical protein
MATATTWAAAHGDGNDTIINSARRRRHTITPFLMAMMMSPLYNIYIGGIL